LAHADLAQQRHGGQRKQRYTEVLDRLRERQQHDQQGHHSSRERQRVEKAEREAGGREDRAHHEIEMGDHR